MAYISEGPRIQLLFPPPCCQPAGSPWHSGTPQPQQACPCGDRWACAPRDSLATEASQGVRASARVRTCRWGGCVLVANQCRNKSVFLARLWLSFPPAAGGPGSSPGRVGCGGGHAGPAGGSMGLRAPPALALACPPHPMALPPWSPGGWERCWEGGVTPLHGLSLGTTLGGCHVPPLRGCQWGQAWLHRG